MKHTVRFLALSAAILLATITGAAASVSIDYDHNVDFSHFKTYAFKFSDDQVTLEKTAPLIHESILKTITKNVEARGLEKAETDPDIYVTYHVTTQQDAIISSGGYGLGAGWGPGWGYSTAAWDAATTMVSTYEEGSLIIDAFSAKTKKAIWRGAAHGVIPEKVDKADQEVAKWINKMFEKWAKTHEAQLEAQGKQD
jgi:hypothetical protein